MSMSQCKLNLMKMIKFTVSMFKKNQVIVFISPTTVNMDVLEHSHPPLLEYYYSEAN